MSTTQQKQGNTPKPTTSSFRPTQPKRRTSQAASISSKPVVRNTAARLSTSNRPAASNTSTNVGSTAVSRAKKPVSTTTKPKPATQRLQQPSSNRNTNARCPATKAPAGKPMPKPTHQNPAEPRADNWLNRTVQGGVAYIGNYAGGLVNSVGDSVNRVGTGIGGRINDTTRQWGQGIAGYGNDIKDSVGAGGPRAATAGNPLGLAGKGSAKTQPSANKTAPQKNGKISGSNPLGLS